MRQMLVVVRAIAHYRNVAQEAQIWQSMRGMATLTVECVLTRAICLDDAYVASVWLNGWLDAIGW